MKFKFTLVSTMIVDVDESAYPGCKTPEDMLNLDIKNLQQCPEMLLDGNAQYEVSGEILEGGVVYENSLCI